MEINGLKRVARRLEKEMEDIDVYREKNGKTKLTFVRKTEKICEHLNFSKIKEDIALLEDEE